MVSISVRLLEFSHCWIKLFVLTLSSVNSSTFSPQQTRPRKTYNIVTLKIPTSPLGLSHIIFLWFLNFILSTFSACLLVPKSNSPQTIPLYLVLASHFVAFIWVAFYLSCECSFFFSLISSLYCPLPVWICLFKPTYSQQASIALYNTAHTLYSPFSALPHRQIVLVCMLQHLCCEKRIIKKSPWKKSTRTAQILLPHVFTEKKGQDKKRASKRFNFDIKFFARSPRISLRRNLLPSPCHLGPFSDIHPVPRVYCTTHKCTSVQTHSHTHTPTHTHRFALHFSSLTLKRPR